MLFLLLFSLCVVMFIHHSIYSICSTIFLPQVSILIASSNIYRVKDTARIYITIRTCCQKLQSQIAQIRDYLVYVIYRFFYFLFQHYIVFLIAQKVELLENTLISLQCGSFFRIGSRRPSLASVHSSTSSSRSYSARRLEKERNDKEQRQALQELRLAKQREQTQQQQQQVVPTPSPRTPHSTDELLPSVEEGKEVFYNEVNHFRSISLEISVSIVVHHYQ